MGDKMSAFDRYYKKDKLVSRKFNIEEEIYNKLQYLSEEVYDASINKLEAIELYNMKNKNYVARSFLIRQTFLDGLYELKDKYKISIDLLVNIAIKNSLR